MILDFINIFRTKETEKIFLNKGSYWFAKILFDRFNKEFPDTLIYYNPIDEKFGCRINNIIYDITGEVFVKDQIWYDLNFYKIINKFNYEELEKKFIFI